MLKAMLALDNTPATGTAIRPRQGVSTRPQSLGVTEIAVLNARRLANVGMVPCGGRDARAEREETTRALSVGGQQEGMRRRLHDFELAYRDSGIRCEIQRVVGCHW